MAGVSGLLWVGGTRLDLSARDDGRLCELRASGMLYGGDGDGVVH